MKKSIVAEIAVGAFVAALFGGYLGKILHRDAASKNEALSMRFRNAHNIGNALMLYSEAHMGILPNQLSALFPEYVANSNLSWFFRPSSCFIGRNDDVDLPHLKWRIDEGGAFVYFGTNGVKADMVLADRPAFWTDFNSSGSGDVVIVTSNLTAHLRHPEDVEEAARRLSLGNRQSLP